MGAVQNSKPLESLVIHLCSQPRTRRSPADNSVRGGRR